MVKLKFGKHNSSYRTLLLHVVLLQVGMQNNRLEECPYSLNDLIKKFEDQTEEYKKITPAYKEGDFILCEALKRICEEIKFITFILFESNSEFK